MILLGYLKMYILNKKVAPGYLSFCIYKSQNTMLLSLGNVKVHNMLFYTQLMQSFWNSSASDLKSFSLRLIAQDCISERKYIKMF